MTVPKVDIAIVRAGANDLEFGNPSNPINGVLVTLPVGDQLDVVVGEFDLLGLDVGAGDERIALASATLLLHLLHLLVHLRCLVHLVQQLVQVPLHHVTHLVTRVQNALLGIIVHASDWERNRCLLNVLALINHLLGVVENLLE